ncbi:MAG: hypothetical protein E7329_03635 [Clostridiales bacterium]|nr:hypothetical protein [Clostridiales bacterium]
MQMECFLHIFPFLSLVFSLMGAYLIAYAPLQPLKKRVMFWITMKTFWQHIRCFQKDTEGR